MNLDKSKLILKKINRLYDLINEFGEASDTEKDLIKAYVVDLYGAVIEDDSEDMEIEEMRKKLKKRKKLEKKLRKKERIVEDTYEEEEQEAEVIAPPVKEEPTIIPQAAKVVAAAAPVAVAAKSVKIAAQTQPKVSVALQELFEVEKGDELSDRLSQTPVPDLTKAMSINERIFTVNELFGGNSDEMKNMLVALNGLSSYEEAKSVLMRSVAAKYDWASSAKAKKARNFIKLIQRRYN